jgi:hypothetical protein
VILFLYAGSLTIQQALRLIKVILGAHAALCLRTAKAMLSIAKHVGSAAVLPSTAGSWPAAIRSVRIVKIVEVVEHEVHVLLLVMLQMVYDALILVYFNAYVRVSLSRDGAWLYEARSGSFLVIERLLTICSRLLLRIVHVVAALRRRHVAHDAVAAVVQLLLTSTHGLVVELARLLLQLVVAHVECVTTEAVITTAATTHLTVAVSVRARTELV